MAEYIVEEPGDRSASWRVHERIVRCRDCKHYEWREHLGRSYCHGEYPTEPDGFCAWGERKEVGE